MDFRVDRLILVNKAATNDTVLGYAFTHYEISSLVPAWFALIFPVLIMILFISVIRRVYKTREAIDCYILFVFVILGGLFVMLLIPTYDKMHRSFMRSKVTDPFEYVYSSESAKNKTHKQLFFISNIHIIIFIACIILLFQLNHSYNKH